MKTAPFILKILGLMEERGNDRVDSVRVKDQHGMEYTITDLEYDDFARDVVVRISCGFDHAV